MVKSREEAEEEMIFYQNGSTYHLYPYCRGTIGEKVELHEIPGAPDPPTCAICEKRKVREGRARLVRGLRKAGLSLAAIGRMWGISRQAVYGLLRED